MAVILEQILLSLWLLCSAGTLDECTYAVHQQYQNCEIESSRLLPDGRFWLSLSCDFT